MKSPQPQERVYHNKLCNERGKFLKFPVMFIILILGTLLLLY